MSLKFKLEISLLLSAILIYVLSAFCYSYESPSQEWVQYIDTPYRVYAFPFTAVASVFLAVAAILYSRRK
jgi:hypothetical protein